MEYIKYIITGSTIITIVILWVMSFRHRKKKFNESLKWKNDG